jgi:hypothetical protein
VNLAHKEGKSLRVEVFLNVLPFAAAAIKEDILLAGMAMHIDVHPHILLLALSKDHLLKVVYFGVVLLAGLFPPSIEIYPRSTKAKVAVAHPVHIYHGHDLKEKPLLEETCRLAIGGELFEEAFHNEGRHCLSGVHSR